MKRPIIILWAACLLGIILVLNWGFTLKHIFFVEIIIFLTFIFFIFDKLQYIIILMCFLIFFFFSSINSLSIVKQSKYLDSYKNEKYSEIKGIVIRENKPSSQYTIESEYVKQESSMIELKQRIIVRTKAGNDLRAGDTVIIKGVLENFEKNKNPGAFNAKNYYMSKKIFCRINSEETIVEKNKKNYFYLLPSIFRDGLLEKLNKLFPKQQADILGKMIIGLNADNESMDLYKIAGISHVLAISGMHISIIASFLLFGFKILFKNQNYVVTFVIILLILYVFVTGAASSAVRAAFMYIVLLSAVYINENYDGISALLFSNMVLLLYNPFLIYDIGFLLSYSAAIGIILISPILNKLIIQNIFSDNNLLNSIVSSISITIAASLGTLPVMLLFFYKIPTYGLLVNLAIVPVISIIFCCSAISLLVFNISIKLAIFISGTSYYSLNYIELICKIAESLPFSYIVAGKPSINIVVSMIIVFMIKMNQEVLIDRLKHKYNDNSIKKTINFVLIILIFLSFTSTAIIRLINWNELKITFLDVGQGDCAVIQYMDKVILVDGGGIKKYYSDKNNNASEELNTSKNTGEYTLLPFLEMQGISKVDSVFISHSDFDHICGIIEIADKIKIEQIIISATYKTKNDSLLIKLYEKAKENNIEILYFSKGESYSHKKLSINCIYPNASEGFQEVNNNNSLILSLNFNRFDLLFTGDIEKEKEKLIESGINRQFEIIKVPHHGSKTSSSLIFLEAIKPGIAIFSYGRDNRFGHPNIEIVDRYKAIGAINYHTASDGAITIKTDGNSYNIHTFITERRGKFLCKN